MKELSSIKFWYTYRRLKHILNKNTRRVYKYLFKKYKKKDYYFSKNEIEKIIKFQPYYSNKVVEHIILLLNMSNLIKTLEYTEGEWSLLRVEDSYNWGKR